jgi:flagellar protein FliS
VNTRTALNAYANIDVEARVGAADPHKLILLLYQEALVAIATARNQMLRQETARKGASVSKAIAIIETGLRASLNKEAGGNLALNLDTLYTHMSHRLITANLENDTGILDEVTRLLTGLRNAWEQVSPRNPADTAGHGVLTPPAQATVDLSERV